MFWTKSQRIFFFFFFFCTSQNLDTSCSIENGKFVFDLYKKPTDSNQFLLTSSIHPVHCHEHIPFSLAMRMTRICTKSETRDKRHQELKEMLLEREYRSGMIESAIKRAKAIPRKQAIHFITDAVLKVFSSNTCKTWGTVWLYYGLHPFLTGPKQVRKRVNFSIAELITHTVCECDAPDCPFVQICSFELHQVKGRIHKKVHLLFI